MLRDDTGATKGEQDDPSVGSRQSEGKRKDLCCTQEAMPAPTLSRVSLRFSCLLVLQRHLRDLAVQIDGAGVHALISGLSIDLGLDLCGVLQRLIQECHVDIVQRLALIDLPFDVRRAEATINRSVPSPRRRRLRAFVSAHGSSRPPIGVALGWVKETPIDRVSRPGGISLSEADEEVDDQRVHQVDKEAAHQRHDDECAVRGAVLLGNRGHVDNRGRRGA